MTATTPTLSNRRVAALLRAVGACPEARAWLGTRDLSTAWAECERGDWLLWIAARIELDRRLIVRAAVACAETALRFVPEGEERPRLAVEAARAWADDPTEEHLQRARRAANAASASAYAADAYAAYAAANAAADAYAAYAAANAAAAAYAAYAASAAYAAADAAYADAYAAYAAADADAYAAYADAYAYAADAARQDALKRCANIVREHIPYDAVLAAATQRLKA